ncbi:DnaJ domain-containing protein [Methyloceanibacter caenitepidi]|uniref:Heat shock protein DnaJ-like n=1 Tax=Methyloceanibacter caenitepidi TaxID=1384459 RepID=A0A0A8K444_9HYPH|nr:DnaJ domain-containing protein [Methyloceanibacter caenitepidi]BAQ17680.1 heat shock protein DnaJ-like [Methyloceanibacter caenitepidi]
MVYFFLGCALLVALLLLGRVIVRANPTQLAGGLRKIGAVALFAVAGFLALRGALPLAIPLAAFALSLIAGSGVGGFGSGEKSKGQASHVQTERLEMELDHDTGYMDGKCLKGRFAGRTLSSLSEAEAVELYATFEADGLKEAALMEAYLDWRVPDWRQQAEEASAGAGRGGFSRGRMSVEEARAVLEVAPDASDQDIRQAHRRLMMKLHPDQGGSTYLAARINEAKDVLIGR